MPSVKRVNYLDSIVWIWKHQLNIEDPAVPATTTLPRRPSTTRTPADNTRTPRAPRPATTPTTTRTTNHHEPPAKKKTLGKDLSFYLEYVICNTPQGGHEGVCSDSQHHNELLGLTAARLLGKLSEVLQMRSRRFAQTFQPLLPVGEDAGKALKVEMRGGERHLDVKVQLKRPIYPNMFEVRTGHMHGLPPGCALYQIRKCQSPEEDLVMRRMWRCCLDKDGFVSPLKVYPWLAKAVLDAVVYLRERDPQWAELDFRLHATFPVIRMEVTFRKKPATSRQPTATWNRTPSAHSNHTIHAEGEDATSKQPTVTGNRTMSARSNNSVRVEEEDATSRQPTVTGNRTMSARSNNRVHAEGEDATSRQLTVTGNCTMSAQSNNSVRGEGEDTTSRQPTVTGNYTMSAQSNNSVHAEGEDATSRQPTVTGNRTPSAHGNHSVRVEEEDATSRQPTVTGNRTPSAHGNHSVHADGKENFETSQWENQSQSNIEISKLSQTLSVPESLKKSTSRASSAKSANYMELRNSTRNSARYSESGRKSALSMIFTRPSSAWEFLFNEDDEEEMNGEPPPTGTLYLNLIPTIEGFGWPKGVRMPQVLPNQRPWSIQAKQWVSDLREQLVNGESFWELTAFDPINVISPSHREYVPYWRMSYRATNDYFLSRITSELAFSSTLDGVLDIIELATLDVGKIWAFLGSQIKDDIRIYAIRENLHRNQTLAEWYLDVLEATIRALQEHQLRAGRAQGEVTILTEASEKNTFEPESSDQGNRLLDALLQVQMVSQEDPKKLVERIQVNDPSTDDDLDLPVQPPADRVMKSSTPVITRRPSMITLDKPLVVNEPVKPQRNLYRLFRKDL